MARSFVLSVALCALGACSKPSSPGNLDASAPRPTGADSIGDAAATPHPSAAATGGTGAEHGTYAGTIGQTDVTMQLGRDGARMTGTYAYAAIGHDLTLSGTIDGDQTIELTERTGPRVTGTFVLSPDAAGDLRGAWTSPDSARRLPVTLTHAGAPLTTRNAGMDAGAALQTAPTRAQVLDFLTAFSRYSKKPPLPRDVLDKKLTYTPDPSGRNWIGVQLESEPSADFDERMKHGLGFDAMSPSLYVVDLDNDGKSDFVLVETNEVADHADQIAGVYDLEGGTLESRNIDAALQAFAKVAPDDLLRNVGGFQREAAGVTFTLLGIDRVDAKGAGVRDVDPAKYMITEKVTLLWKEGRIRRLHHLVTTQSAE